MKSPKILNKSEDCSGFTKILRIYNVYWKSESTYNKSVIESEDRHAISESKYQINVQYNMNEISKGINLFLKQIRNNDPSL